MIVEFLGISGVGKTFIATQYSLYLESKGINYIWPWKNLYSKGYVIRNLKKALGVSWELITTPKWCIRLFKYLRHQDIRGKRDLPVLFFNGIFLNHAYKKYAKTKDVVLFDEGIAQFLWAVHFRNRKGITEREIQEFLELFSLPYILYIVKASSEVILERMEKRNVRDEIRERGNAMDEIENGQKAVEMISQTFSPKLCCNLVFIDNEGPNSNKNLSNWFLI